MKLDELRPAPGADASAQADRPRARARATARPPARAPRARGRARAAARAAGFEGGQMPLYRRLPKRGFLPFGGKTRYAVVNLKSLAGFAAGSVVDPDGLAQAGLIKRSGRGRGEDPGRRRRRARAHGARARHQRVGAGEDRGARRPGRGAGDQGEGDRFVIESLQSVPEHLQDPGAQAPGPDDPPAALRLPCRRPRADARHRRPRAGRSSSTRCRARCWAWSTCSRAATCDGCRSSRWASCRTSRPRSSCSC